MWEKFLWNFESWFCWIYQKQIWCCRGHVRCSLFSPGRNLESHSEMKMKDSYNSDMNLILRFKPSTLLLLLLLLTFSILFKDNRLWRRRRQFVVTWRGIRSSRIHSSVRGQVSWAGSWLVHWLQLSSHCLTQCGIGSLQL